jgi:hypothetical protein
MGQNRQKIHGGEIDDCAKSTYHDKAQKSGPLLGILDGGYKHIF